MSNDSMTETTPIENAPAADVESIVHPAEEAGPKRRRLGDQLRFMLVALTAVVVLFLAFVILVAFNASGESVIALAVVAAPIATMVAAYYGITLTIAQTRTARESAAAADERARLAEVSRRESDAWAAQMEAGLRLAVSKLRAARTDTQDVERAAGTPDDFF